MQKGKVSAVGSYPFRNPERNYRPKQSNSRAFIIIYGFSSSA